ncbi:hypothetical protein ALP60_102231 [Pseudomonas savastanoi]|uniref:Uncharacterized protein n=1 Tax=Pseudomonas savastanoi TaxID=29438 RepID=A0A3M5FI49_PSESS|nr:hypothetical protein ALP60_102231 [Pseudomonas savastanoi]
MAVRGGLSEVAAQRDEHLGATFGHGVNGFDDVVTIFAGYFELEAFFQGIEQEHRWALVDAHGAVTLHVTVTAHRAQAGTRTTDVAAQQHQVGDFLDGRHRVTVLGNPHRPAHDYVLALGVHACRLFDVAQWQTGLLDDGVPGRVIDGGQVFEHAFGVFVEERVVEHRRCVVGLRLALPLQQELGHAAQQRHVATQGRAEVGGVGRAVAVGEHFDRVLRMLETLQATLFERVHAHHLGAALYRFTQWLEHARVVGAGVLAEDEDGIGVFEILEGHGALADADALRQRYATGLVAHVRAVREVVGAISAHEQLIQVRRFVAGAAGGVELGHVRAGQVLQVLGDQRKRVVPADRLVTVGFRVIAHRLGQAALILEPVIALLHQRADAVAGEEGRVDTTLGRFPVHRLGAVLAELDHAAFRRITPRTARAVETAVLVGLEHHAQVLQRVVTAQPVLRHADQCAPAACRTFVRLVAGGWCLVGLMMSAHA